MIWNIPSIEHILSACLNYSLNSSLKKCAHTHAHTHKHTGICEYTDYGLCIYSQKRMGGWTDKYICSNVKWVTVCNVWQQHQLKLYTQALPSSSISTKQNLLCVCVYLRICNKCVWAWPGSRALSGYTHTGRLRAITKAFQRNPQQVKIKCFRSNW